VKPAVISDPHSYLVQMAQTQMGLITILKSAWRFSKNPAIVSE